MKCLRPGCDRPAKSNGNGRPGEYCSTACKQSVHRMFTRLSKRCPEFINLLNRMRMVTEEIEFKRKLYELAAIMDAIAAHPLVGSRAVHSRPVVPSPQPLPGATPISRSAGQGAAFAAYQDWPEDD